jgi:phosphatidate cytidylyltransferase
VLLTAGSIIWSKYAFAVLFVVFLAYTLYEFYRLYQHAGFKPQVVIGLVIGVYLFASCFLYERLLVPATFFLGIIPMLMLIPVIELLRKNDSAMQNITSTIFGIIYIALPFSLLNFIATPYHTEAGTYVPVVLLGLFVILWANDSGAYLVGSWLGKHKMLERISPKKTWEGAIGGALFAMAVSVLLFRFFNILSIFDAIILGILTIVAGTFGDLIESMIKRSFLVKDSGRIMPGHGGMLDRFDSMLFAAPIYFCYITLILN